MSRFEKNSTRERSRRLRGLSPLSESPGEIARLDHKVASTPDSGAIPRGSLFDRPFVSCVKTPVIKVAGRDSGVGEGLNASAFEQTLRGEETNRTQFSEAE